MQAGFGIFFIGDLCVCAEEQNNEMFASEKGAALLQIQEHQDDLLLTLL